MPTAHDCMMAGLAAHMNGDLKERDRQFTMSTAAKEDVPAPIELVQGPDGIYAPKGAE